MKTQLIIASALLMATGATAAEKPSRFTSLRQLTPEVLHELQGEGGASTRTMLTRTNLPQETSYKRVAHTSEAPVAMQQPQARVSLSGAKFTGWLTANSQENGGYYQLDTDGSYSMLWSNKVAELGITLNNGWIKNGKLCGLGSLASGGIVLYYNYLEFDLATGAPLTETPIGSDNLIDLSNYYLSSTYVAEEDRIYGYTYADNEGSGYNFCSSPASDIADVTVIKHISDNTERTGSICYHAEDGLFYGVNYNGEFVTIDRKGMQNRLFKLDVATLRTEPSALVYSPLDDAFLYCAYYFDYATQLYFIHPEKKKADFITNMPSDYQFTFLLNDDCKYDATAPARPEIVSMDIAQGALEGKIVYRLPSKSAGGDAISGNLDWNLYIDNTLYKSGNAASGSEVSVDIKDLKQGLHVIRMNTAKDGKTGLSCVESQYFGNGIPYAPENVSIDGLKVSWDAVTAAEYGAYLDLSKLNYEVYVNGDFIESTQNTAYTLKLDDTKPYSAYAVTVKAKCNGQTSASSQSVKTLFGAPFALPYGMTPTQAEADLTTVINADGSPSYGEWAFSEARWHEPVFYSGWNLVKADDWLILPPVDCSDISHAFRITFDAVCGGMASSDERFEVWCGSAPTVEAMKTLIIPETAVSNFITEGWETFSNLFLPREAGPCYIAIRAVSPPQSYSLLVRKIKIEATDEPAAVPMAPTDVKLVSKSDADLTATVSFKMPTTTISGSEFAENSTLKAILKAGDNIVDKEAKAGETVTLTIGTKQGTNRIEALCSLDGQNGQSATFEVFTGTIPPNYVENLQGTISEDNLSIQLKWDEPLGGQENLEGYYSPEGMTYWLYEQVWNAEYEVYEWLPVKELGNVKEYTYSVADNARLGMKYVGVVAANAGGISEALSYVFRVVGRPYASIDEHFDNGQTHYGPMVVKTPSAEYQNSGWDMVAPEEVSSSMWSVDVPYAMIGYTDNEDGGKTRITLPKFKTADVEYPTVTLTLWTGEHSGKVSVYATAYANQTTAEKIFDVPASNAKWETFTIAIPEKYQNLGWLELSLDCTLDSYYTYTLLGGYTYGKGVAGVNDISAAEGKSITYSDGAIAANGFKDGSLLTIYTMDGRVCAQATVKAGSACIDMPEGIYIAKCADKTIKVLVK